MYTNQQCRSATSVAVSATELQIVKDALRMPVKHGLVQEATLERILVSIKGTDGSHVHSHDEWLTRRESCHLLKISLPTLDKQLAAGTFHSRRIGERSVRISRNSIEAYLAGREV